MALNISRINGLNGGKIEIKALVIEQKQFPPKCEVPH